MQQSASRSFLRRYILTLPSAWLTLKRDSSEKSTVCHWRRVKFKWRLAHISLATRWCPVKICPVYGRRARIGRGFFLRRLIIVCGWTPYRLAVTVAGKKRLCRCVNVIMRSSRNVVTGGRPDLARSLTDPVILNLFLRLWIVCLVQPIWRATLVTLSPCP